MSGRRFEGKNLDEALDQASSALGIERFQLQYHVILEKRGFLGGLKRVVIEAEGVALPPEAGAPESVPAAIGRSAGSSAPRPQPARLPAGGRNPRAASAPSAPEREGRPSRRKGRSSRGRGGRELGSDQPLAPKRTLTPTPAQTLESAEATKVRKWSEELFDRCGFDVDVRSRESEDVIQLELYGADSRLFLERNGELLDSAQVILRKVFEPVELGKSVELNCDQFRERRESELGERARRLADQVSRDGREQSLPAMNPIERRIVHLALQDSADVATESRGEGFFKRIAIVPRKQVTTSEP